MLSSGSIFGKYEINSVLGEGGVGIVYCAKEIENSRIVALKLLSDELAHSTEYREKLATEAKLSASIDSPFVVKIWECDEFENQPYISMEYIAGDDLRSAMEELEFDQKLELAIQIGQGIEAAHGADLVHRDLKPENIKLTEDGLPKILDFGLAKIIDSESVDEQGDIEGTLHYFSPEQLSGDPITPSSDLFSYGTIIYEMCSGMRPFEGEYSASIIYSILHEEPELPTEVNEDLPVWFDQFIGRLLAKNPSERFENMQEALKFLKESRETGLVPGHKWVKPRETVTVVDLRNLSGDSSWNYFAEGFTDDVVKELSRRTDLIVNAEPATAYRRNIRETFEKCRSDFVIVGSLMKWQEQIKLSLSIYGDDGEELIWDSSYADDADKLFDLLANAARDASVKLASATDSTPISVDDDFQPNVTAYDCYLKGKAYYQTNKPDDLKFAEQMFNRALEIDPNFALAYSGLSDVYAFEYMAYYNRSAEKIAAAMESAQKAKSIDKKLQEAHRSIARCYMFTGEFNKGEKSLLNIIDLHPKYAIAYRTLGWLKHSQGKFEESMKWARKSLELAPTDLETLLLLSLINMNQGKYTLAMATLQRALELGPDYGRAYYNLGQVYTALGVLDPALENFELAAKYKGDPNCLIDCGYVHLVRKEFDSARLKFKDSIKEGYFPFVAKYFLGLIELLNGDTEEANEYFNESIELIKGFDLTLRENIHVRAYLAMALAGAGRGDESRQILDELENSKSLGGDVLFLLARGYALLGDNQKASEVLSRSIEGTSGLTLSRGPTQKEADIDPHFSLYAGSTN